MCFSLDLINFSGADSLHIIIISGAIRCIYYLLKVLITLSGVPQQARQAYHAGIPQSLY